MLAGMPAKVWPAWLYPFVSEMLRRRCCVDCACELPPKLVCPRCKADHRLLAGAVIPACEECGDDLVSCGRCWADWCLGCTPGPLRCPECGQRGCSP